MLCLIHEQANFRTRAYGVSCWSSECLLQTQLGRHGRARMGMWLSRAKFGAGSGRLGRGVGLTVRCGGRFVVRVGRSVRSATPTQGGSPLLKAACDLQARIRRRSFEAPDHDALFAGPNGEPGGRDQSCRRRVSAIARRGTPPTLDGLQTSASLCRLVPWFCRHMSRRMALRRLLKPRPGARPRGRRRPRRGATGPPAACAPGRRP